MYKARIKEKWWFSQCGRTWLVCRKQLNTSGVTLNALNSSSNTIDLYIHYMDKSTGTPPSLEEKNTLPNCGNKDGNIIHVLKNCICTSVATVLKCMKWLYPVIGVWWWIFGSRSAFKVTPEVFSCFLQTSQVLPHWLNHHFYLILVLYTETLSC